PDARAALHRRWWQSRWTRLQRQQADTTDPAPHRMATTPIPPQAAGRCRSVDTQNETRRFDDDDQQ
ncbi:MAG: hypothetical protein WAV90_26575, partial [Gordonia amarae]